LVALPNSIVGSIGSISMNANVSETFAKLGITVDRVTVGPHATVLSSFADMTRGEYERFEAVHRSSYEAWVEGVAHHRGMTLTQVDAVARGRVFTGRQALENGLIDELGGFAAALQMLKEQAGIPADDPVSLVHLPRQKGFIERLVAGEIGRALRTVLAGPAETEVLRASLAFWQRLLESEDELALFWWHF
jgi:protease-4